MQDTTASMAEPACPDRSAHNLSWRYTVSRDALLTVDEAAACLRVRRSVGEAWLREHDLIRDVPGIRKLVRWGRVLDAIDNVGAPSDDVRLMGSAAKLFDLPSAGTLGRKKEL
jgi:hypothetical protein